MKALVLAPPIAWRLQAWFVVVALLAPPALISVSVIGAIFIPGNLGTGLTALATIWLTAFVGYVALIGWKIVPRVYALTTLELMIEEGQIRAHGKLLSIEHVQLDLGANSSQIRVYSEQALHVVASGWANFDVALVKLTDENAQVPFEVSVKQNLVAE